MTEDDDDGMQVQVLSKTSTLQDDCEDGRAVDKAVSRSFLCWELFPELTSEFISAMTVYYIMLCMNECMYVCM